MKVQVLKVLQYVNSTFETAKSHHSKLFAKISGLLFLPNEPKKRRTPQSFCLFGDIKTSKINKKHFRTSSRNCPMKVCQLKQLSHRDMANGQPRNGLLTDSSFLTCNTPLLKNSVWSPHLGNVIVYETITSRSPRNTLILGGITEFQIHVCEWKQILHQRKMTCMQKSSLYTN